MYKGSIKKAIASDKDATLTSSKGLKATLTEVPLLGRRLATEYQIKELRNLKLLKNNVPQVVMVPFLRRKLVTEY